MKSTTKNFENRRKVFEKGLSFYTKNNVVPQRAKLKAVAELKEGDNKLTFKFTKDPSLKHAIEMLLEKTDLFVGQAIGLALMLEADAAPGMSPLMTYPVQAGDHLPAGLVGFENAETLAIYNGILGMKTGSTVNYSRIPTDEFLYIPETQPACLVNEAGDALVSNGVWPAFNVENVMMQLEEVLFITGTKTQPFNLEFPALSTSTFGIPAGYKAYVVLIVDGIIYETGATPEMKQEGNPYKDMF